MGKKAIEAKRRTQRTIRVATEPERERLRKIARYQGHPHHKKNPGDFGLSPPAAPRPDKTLCDEADVYEKSVASELLERAVCGGLVSESTTAAKLPKQMWAVDDEGRVFEAMQGGDTDGSYHGYPIRKSDVLFKQVHDAWEKL